MTLAFYEAGEVEGGPRKGDGKIRRRTDNRFRRKGLRKRDEEKKKVEIK